MKTKAVTRYQCDFCDKKGYSAGHMRRHEAHCTLNPLRSCRVCTIMIGNPQPDTAALVKILPDQTGHKANDGQYSEAFVASLKACWNELESEAGECPACIMAAMRQAGIPVPVASWFDYKARSKEIFDEKRNEDSMHGVYPV